MAKKISNEGMVPTSLGAPEAIKNAAAAMNAMLQAWGPAGEVMVDTMQRTVLYWDLMRRRSGQYDAQKAKEVPHVLNFEAEQVLDGRTLKRPVNYGLVCIKPPAGVVINPRKRPFVVVDPRAGHGPGIGGFKADSELGVAMRAGHPCYFDINLDVVWETTQEWLPVLLEQLPAVRQDADHMDNSTRKD